MGLSAWIEVPDFRWDALVAAGRTVRFAKGALLFAQGEPVEHVYVLEQGRVRLVLTTSEGHEQHMAIVGTQGMVGECSAFTDGRHSLTAIASADVVARKVSRSQLVQVVDDDPVSRRQVLWLIGTKLRILAHQNLLLSQGSALQRVASHLAQLADTYGEPTDAGTLIRIAFTHQEMANIAGLSRVMTSNVLARLHRDELIGKSAAHYVIRDLVRLRACEVRA